MASSHTNDNQTEKTAKQAAVERAQWLRAAILGANDGLLSTTSLILGVSAAAEHDRRSIILSGLAGALAGAFSMAAGEFVSVSTQRDIEEKLFDLHEQPKLHHDEEYSRTSTPGRTPVMRVMVEDQQGLMKVLPSPHKAAAASGAAFLCGAVVPLAFSVLVVENIVRVGMLVVVATVVLAVFGGVGARLGGSPVKVSILRVVVGGWLAMAVTYGLLKPFDRDGHE
ncbi:hypothetical protein TIFTF001_018858 [Ficus carica]|uniref:Vacuolar iron transporter n=1 Tax=Ficus carica TaxID=3494 RepID=A0AA88AD96_FICCA|nr:hypothetical protein TIFTF001_018858 [Ficus carica]